MPQDNFENFLKDKIGELDETLPPDVAWNTALGWNQLQSKLPAQRRLRFVWYQAAAVVLLLLSTLLFLKIPSENSNTTTPVDSLTKSHPNPASFKLPSGLPPVTTPDSGLGAAPANLAASKRIIAVPKKRDPINKNTLAFSVKKKNDSLENPGHNITQNAHWPLEKAAEPLQTDALLKQEPIKITVVLGGKSRRETVIATSKVPTEANRRKNKRLKLRVGPPGEIVAEDSSLTATANQLPNRSALRAQINL